MDADRLLSLFIRDQIKPAALALSSADSLLIELRRLLRDLRVFQVVHAALVADGADMPAGEPHMISKALAAVRTPDLILRGRLPGDMAVLGAPGALEMVLWHLLSNAQRHGRGAPFGSLRGVCSVASARGRRGHLCVGRRPLMCCSRSPMKGRGYRQS